MTPYTFQHGISSVFRPVAMTNDSLRLTTQGIGSVFRPIANDALHLSTQGMSSVFRPIANDALHLTTQGMCSVFRPIANDTLHQGCPTRGPRAAMRTAWCLGAAHYSFSL